MKKNFQVLEQVLQLYSLRNEIHKKDNQFKKMLKNKMNKKIKFEAKDLLPNEVKDNKIQSHLQNNLKLQISKIWNNKLKNKKNKMKLNIVNKIFHLLKALMKII